MLHVIVYYDVGVVCRVVVGLHNIYIREQFPVMTARINAQIATQISYGEGQRVRRPNQNYRNPFGCN
jgi:hypothetical protein